MSRPSFLEGVLVALIAALGASVVAVGLSLAFAPAQTLTLVWAPLGLGYLLYLLARSGESAGRVLLVLGWLATTGLSLALIPSPLAQAATQLGLIWIGRVWGFQGTPLAALLDLGLILAGGLAGLWAMAHTASLLLAVWSLMLVQALFVFIPARPGHAADSEPIDPDPFDLARRAARLRAVTPKLRAKGAARAVDLFLTEDALTPVALANDVHSTLSDRAARRLCDRLVELGALRELTGRDSFRLYGL